MRRKWIISALAISGLAVAFVAWQTSGQGPGKVVKGGLLPIRHVVLFNSGVGYLQRDGEVDGNAHVDLSFPTNDINDLLKSMVLQDLGGGRFALFRIGDCISPHNVHGAIYDSLRLCKDF